MILSNNYILFYYYKFNHSYYYQELHLHDLFHKYLQED